MLLDEATSTASEDREYSPANRSPSSTSGLANVLVDSDKLSIVHVVRQYRPSIGGLEAVVEQLARRQAAAGCDVRVVTLDRLFGAPRTRLPARETIDGVTIIRVPFVGSRRYPFAPAVLRHIKGASLVHVHGVDFFFDFLAATRQLHGLPIVATTHGGFFHTDFAGGLKRWWFDHVTKRTVARYGAIVACSQADATLFRTLAPPRLETIENGIDLDRFAWQPMNAAKAMICFGRMSPNKGLDDLIAWFGAVRRLDPDWTLTIAGSPDGVSPEALRAQADALGVGQAVRIVVAPDAATLSAMIAESAVYCSASHYEGFGLAALEAGVSGLFPVLRDIEPFACTVERLGTGMLSDFAADDVAPGEFLEQWRAWRDSRASGRPAAHESLGWEPASQAYGALYREVLRSPRRIGPVEVEVRRPAEVVQLIERHVADHEPLTVAFCNAHTVNVARDDPRFASCLKDATVVNDGIGVDLASRILFGRAFPENLNGTDLTPAILAGVDRPLRIFLVGSPPGVARRAAIALARRFPGHRFVGTSSGFLAPGDEPELCRRIIESRADLVLVGMGHPYQELWASNHAREIGAVVICVGAFLDFAAGEVSRAPGWVRSLRLEWAFRLLLEPRRLAGRYLYGIFSFLYHVLRQRITRQRLSELPT